jgi:hypothetical protein
MKVEKDYEELLKLFNKYKVRYCIIGAFAVGFYAQPRYTKDMNILVEPSLENGEKIVRALGEFGFGSLPLSAKDFTEKGKFMQLGYEPIRVDIITSMEHLGFKEIWNNKKIGAYGNERVFFIGLDELIKAKKISNRKQDKADLEILQLIKKRKRV